MNRREAVGLTLGVVVGCDLVELVIAAMGQNTVLFLMSLNAFLGWGLIGAAWWVE
jgi:hypothetical protein